MEKRTVIITGGGSGIGAATSRLFAERGEQVVIADINMDAATKVSEELISEGFEAYAVKVDVTIHDEVRSLISDTVERFGGLDVMVNNAGIGPRRMAKTADHTMEDWDTVVSVNQTGVFYCMKEALSHMVEHERGNIVNVASLAGMKAAGGMLSYTASKFAVVGMTKSAALEYASKGIRINAVCPGYTESPLLDELLVKRPDMDSVLLAHIPMKRFGDPMEIAEAIYWLSSDQTKFITGHALVLDGGTSL